MDESPLPEQKPNTTEKPSAQPPAPATRAPDASEFSNEKILSRINERARRTEEALSTPIQRIRTFKSDIAEAMNKQNASLVSIAAAEQERRGNTSAPARSTQKTGAFSIKKILVGMLGGILLIGGGAIIVYILFFHKGEEVVVTPDVPSLIFADEQREIDASSKDSRSLLQTLTEAKHDVVLSLGEVEQLYIITKTIDGTPTILTSQDFLSAINARVSSSFLRSINATFTLGVHVFDGNQPFIILASNSYENTFAGMLAWEETMQGTLAPLFGPLLPPAFQDVTTTGTSTESGTLPIARVFNDRVIRNIDARVLTDDSGKIVLLYAFPSQQLLVITTNEQTLVEIISRLSNTRVF
jgi:hypothetical protein